MTNERAFALIFASVYPHYVKKAETKEELDQVIRWLTGYGKSGLEKTIEKRVDLRTFFDKAPKFSPNADMIKGVVCGIRVEDIVDPLMQKIRYMDKLVRRTRQREKDGYHTQICGVTRLCQ